MSDAASFANAPATLASVPNQPKTPNRTVRVPDDEWWPAKAAAEGQGATITDVIRDALRRYVKRHGRAK